MALPTCSTYPAASVKSATRPDSLPSGSGFNVLFPPFGGSATVTDRLSGLAVIGLAQPPG